MISMIDKMTMMKTMIMIASKKSRKYKSPRRRWRRKSNENRMRILRVVVFSGHSKIPMFPSSIKRIRKCLSLQWFNIAIFQYPLSLQGQSKLSLPRSVVVPPVAFKSRGDQNSLLEKGTTVVHKSSLILNSSFLFLFSSKISCSSRSICISSLFSSF